MKYGNIKKFICILLLLPFGVMAEATRVADNNIPFFYDVYAKIKTPVNKLAAFISSDYRTARDEFTKHELFQQIKPIINERLAKAKNTKKVFFLVGGNLGNYNFEKKAFSTGFDTTTYIPFKNGYSVVFSNSDKIKFLPVPIKSAKTLSSELRNSREATFKIRGVIVGAEESAASLNNMVDSYISNNGYSSSTKKTLEVRITKVEVKLKSGKKVGTKIIK